MKLVRTAADVTGNEDLLTGEGPSRFERLLRLDCALLLKVRGWERDPLTRLMRAWTRLGDPGYSLLLPALFLLLFQDGARYATLFVVASVCGVLVSQLVKRTTRRRRPLEDLGEQGFAALLDASDAFSFPSGHACAAFAAAFALLGEGTMLLSGGLLFVASGIAASRVYLGVHYPLDVVAGITLGGMIGVLVRYFLG